MNINRNQDWENAQKRLEAFWHNEILDRPCIQIYAPAPEADYADLEPLTECNHDIRWTDPEIYFNSFREEYMHTRYLGEAFPNLYPNWAGEAQMFGCPIKYDKDTIWVRPAANTVLDVDAEKLDIDHPTVHQLLEKLAYCAEHGSGEAFIGMPPMGNVGDSLARICGYNNLCIDLIDNPEEIFIIEEKLTAFWKQMYEKVYRTINQYMKGSCGWLPSWHPGRSAIIEFDFGALVSPEMFRKYLPYLLERAEFVEKTIYHLDGPDALIHLDTILAQKEFHAIQWEPGVACENILEYIPVMQKIQAAGKGLYIASPRYSAEAVLELLKNLRPEGLIIPLTVSSVDEGERFLETVEKMF